MTEASDLVHSGAVELGAVVVEIDESDDPEEARIARYLADGCSCQHGARVLHATSYFRQHSIGSCVTSAGNLVGTSWIWWLWDSCVR